MKVFVRCCLLLFLAIGCCYLSMVHWEQQPVGRKIVAIDVPPPEPFFFEVQSNDLKDLKCLAQNIYFEARGESRAGKFAVAFVTINRVRSKEFPENICRVVYQRRKDVCQFSWKCDQYSDVPRRNTKAWRKCFAVATAVFYGYYRHEIIPDETGGALYFFRTDKDLVASDSAIKIDHQLYYR